MSLHELCSQQQALLEELDQLQEAVADLTALLVSAAADQDEGWDERREQLAWLHRQQTSAQVALGEIERALLALMTDEPELD